MNLFFNQVASKFFKKVKPSFYMLTIFWITLKSSSDLRVALERFINTTIGDFVYIDAVNQFALNLMVSSILLISIFEKIIALRKTQNQNINIEIDTALSDIILSDLLFRTKDITTVFYALTILRNVYTPILNILIDDFVVVITFPLFFALTTVLITLKLLSLDSFQRKLEEF